MAIGNEKYVCTTTYRKSGARIATATWIVAMDDGKVGFWTSSMTGKAKRLKANSAISVQPGDSRGRPKPGSQQLRGTAVMVTGGPEYDAIISGIKAKYGFMTKLTKLLNTIGHRGKWPYADVGVVITLSPQNGAEAS